MTGLQGAPNPRNGMHLTVKMSCKYLLIATTYIVQKTLRYTSLTEQKMCDDGNGSLHGLDSARCCPADKKRTG